MPRFDLRSLVISETWFGRIVVGGVALGFLALVATGIAAALVVLRNQDHTRWVNHTYEVERAISTYQILTERAETARRGYLLNGDEHFARTFRDTAAAIPPVLERIARLTRDNPRQQARMLPLRRLTAHQMELLDSSIATVRAGHLAAALVAFYDDGSIAGTRAIRAYGQAMIEEENRLLLLRNEQQRTSLELFFVILSIAAVLLLVVAVGSIWVILRYTRDLGASRDALRSLNENLEQAVDARTADLQRANDEIQRFAYIVSHDLRSPLVNVMGFTAELDASARALGGLIDRAESEAPAIVTDEARTAARDDLPEAIGFIRSSTQKMDRLINAILKLSREGRRVIAPEPLDMDAVMQGISDSLHHRATEIGAEIRIEKPLPPLFADRVAIEQIFSNLIENAVKYLKPGRPGTITVRGRRDLARLIFEVEDNGRGIDPKDHERVFDLFRRSGTQDQPGEGIGLAHVRALVYRLGGVISCRSALDKGATFRISLPAVIAGENGGHP